MGTALRRWHQIHVTLCGALCAIGVPGERPVHSLMLTRQQPRERFGGQVLALTHRFLEILLKSTRVEPLNTDKEKSEHEHDRREDERRADAEAIRYRARQWRNDDFGDPPAGNQQSRRYHRQFDRTVYREHDRQGHGEDAIDAETHPKDQQIEPVGFRQPAGTTARGRRPG